MHVWSEILLQQLKTSPNLYSQAAFKYKELYKRITDLPCQPKHLYNPRYMDCLALQLNSSAKEIEGTHLSVSLQGHWQLSFSSYMVGGKLDTISETH